VEAEMFGRTSQDSRWKTLLAPALALLLACMTGSFARGDTIPDEEMTAEEFDDTIDFEPDYDADEAMPPTPVHESDEDQITAAGGKLVVAGENWLDADNTERNDILNLVAEAQPENTMLVIVVATGDIWQIPVEPLQLLPSNVRAWTGDEYAEMDEYYRGRRPRAPFLTIGLFRKITEVENRDAFQPIQHVKVFGDIGYREIESRDGFQVVLSKTWLRETPVQRSLRLMALQSYLQRFPQFQGEGNQLTFGIVVPGGSVYAMPRESYRDLIGQGGVRAWTAYDIEELPSAETQLGRWIRGERLTLPERIDIP
jgi:hypothetical protein